MATRPGGDRPRTISIATLLAVSIGGLVGVTVAAVLAVTFAAGGRNTVDLLGDKASLTVDLAETRLTGHLDPATRQLQFLGNLITERMEREVSANPPPGGVEPALIAAMTQTLASTPQIFGISWWPGDDSMTAVARIGDGGTIETVYRRAPIAEIPEAAEALGWLRSLRSATWGDPTYVQALGESALNLGVPVTRPGPGGEPIHGGLIAIVTVRELSRFIGELAVTDAVEGQLTPFIFYGQDRILAHPTLAGGSIHLALSPDHVLPGPADLGDETLTALAEGLWNPSEVINPGVDSRIVDLEDDERIVLSRAIEGYADRPITLGVYASTAEIGSELFRMFRAGAIGLILMIVSIVIGVLVGRRIARPVQRLAAQAGTLARLDFAHAEPVPVGRLTELAEQARAFNTMLAGLRWFETYVPKTLVKRLMARDQGETAESESRDMTVMFTDIAGFTTLSEAMPADQTAAFLNAHFALLAACVEAEGGTIDKYIGDGLMAFWGAPEDQPDHADRACRAARAIAMAVAGDNLERQARGEPPLHLRIGVHSGAMVVGNIGAPGRINYTIVGDAVNTGQRLEALGKQVDRGADVVALCSQSVIDRLNAPLDPPPRGIGGHRLSGRREPIEVWRLD